MKAITHTVTCEVNSNMFQFMLLGLGIWVIA